MDQEDATMTSTPDAPREPEQEPQSDPESPTPPAAEPPYTPPGGTERPQPQYGQPQPGRPQSDQPQPGQPEPGKPQPGHYPPPPPPPPGQTPYDQPSYGQPPYGQPAYGQPPYGQEQYGQPQPGQPQYGYGYGQGQPYGMPGTALPIGMPPFAGWWERVAAFLLDNGIAIIGGGVGGSGINRGTEIAFDIIGLAGLIWAIYNAVIAGRTGQSFGKRTVGIRLARFVDGQPVGGGYGFLRLFLNWLFFVLCFLPGILNYLWPLWDAKHQTWSDKIAKSVVVKA